MNDSNYWKIIGTEAAKGGQIQNWIQVEESDVVLYLLLVLFLIFSVIS